MLLAWIAVSVGIAAALSAGAVLWDLAVEAANSRERTRAFARRVLLLEAADRFAGSLDSAAATLDKVTDTLATLARNFFAALRAALPFLGLLVAVVAVLGYWVMDLAGNVILWVLVVLLALAFILIVGRAFRRR